ncbi:glycoside hydrolase family 3 protein, partial [Streptomyces bambusae]|nr:glycoside hydrolase family 3 protein [Streptomyces bambusae]
PRPGPPRPPPAARGRALAEWTRQARATAAPGAPEEGSAPGIGLTAARRALVVSGTPVAVARPYVATLAPVANIAVGDETPWGVAAELAELVPDTASGTYAEGATAADVLAAAGDRTIVAVVRDAHRHAWMAQAVAALISARPDTVVVEMGLPRARPSGAFHVATHGAARVCGRAAAEIIAGA